MNADDLDDGLAYSVEYSDDDTAVAIETDDGQSRKRKIEEKEATKKAKKLKNSNKDDHKAAKRAQMEADVAKKQSMSFESPEIIVEYLNDQVRRKRPNLSALELSELYINKLDVRSTSDYTDTRNLSNLAKFITARFGNMLLGDKKKGKKGKKGNKDKKVQKEEPADATTERKFIAVVSMSAIRACDVHRALRDIPGSSLKVINKSKLEDDLTKLKTTRSRVLCCTPGRLSKVLKSEGGELKGDEIKIVIVENTYLNEKKWNVFDLEETPATLKQLTEAGSKLYLY